MKQVFVDFLDLMLTLTFFFILFVCLLSVSLIWSIVLIWSLNALGFHIAYGATEIIAVTLLSGGFGFKVVGR